MHGMVSAARNGAPVLGTLEAEADAGDHLRWYLHTCCRGEVQRCSIIPGLFLLGAVSQQFFELCGKQLLGTFGRHGYQGRCENETFVQDFPQNLKVEDVKTKLSCETPLQKPKLKL